MSDESLIRAMPDLVMFVRPDGLVMDHSGGRTLPFLLGCGNLVGRQVQKFVEPAGTVIRVSVAPGIDDEPSRAMMAGIGCSQGLGDLYPPVEHVANAPRAKRYDGAVT